MAAGGPGLSGIVERDRRRLREAAGHTGEKVVAGDPHHILRLVHSVFTNPYITREGLALERTCSYSHQWPSGGREGHTYSHYHKHNTSVVTSGSHLNTKTVTEFFLYSK